MPQSDGSNTLKRFEFRLGEESYRFKLNPEEYSQDEPSRSTVTQTKGGAWIDDFGGGLEIIFMRGSTGLNNGYNRFVNLRNLIRRYKDDTNPGKTPNEELTFHNFTDNESWIVHLDPAGFKLFRSKTNPLMFMYEIRLVCLRKASQPQKDQQTEVIVDRDEFSQRVELGQLGNLAGSRKGTGGVVGPLRIPSRLANAAGSMTGTALGVTSGNYLEFFSQSRILDEIKPRLDARLSPIGMHYYTNIINRTFTPIGEYPDDNLGYLVFNVIGKYELWQKYSEPFTLIMLDLYALTDAYNNRYELFKNRFSERDAHRLIENIRWLVQEIEPKSLQVDKDETPILHEVTGIMREVELVLSRMRKDKNLFDVDISEELRHLNTVRGTLPEREV